ncbi:hypothetical protein E4U52_000740, partial [Claviceps spartinae]
HSRRSGTLKEGTGSVYEIKESSSLLVESPQKAAELNPAAHVMLHVKMMELGDIYMVEGLSEPASKKLEDASRTRDQGKSYCRHRSRILCLEIRFVHNHSEIMVHRQSKRLHPPPLATDIVETMAEVARVVLEFGSDMLMSYCNASDLFLRL